MQRKTLIIAILAAVFCCLTVFECDAARQHPEKWYQEQWSAGKGLTEVRMPDGTRCDCLTDDHAIEFDFGNKWAESIGQSLYYSLQTGKRAGIVLILEDIQDRKYWLRLNSTIRHYGLPIDTWAIGDGAP